MMMMMKRRAYFFSSSIWAFIEAALIAFFTLSFASSVFFSAFSFAVLSKYSLYAACASGESSSPGSIISGSAFVPVQFSQPPHEFTLHDGNVGIFGTPVNFPFSITQQFGSPTDLTQFVVDSCNVLHSCIPQQPQHIQLVHELNESAA